MLLPVDCCPCPMPPVPPLAADTTEIPLTDMDNSGALSADGSRCGCNVAAQTQILIEARAQSQ